MSTPPYYQNTPPPAKSNSGGCWKAAGIGCGVIILLGIIGGIVAVQQFKQAMSNPKQAGGIMGSIMGPVSTAQDGVKIRQAIISYHDASGKYPVKLTDLVPKYLPNKSILHGQMDSNPDPSHVSWTYTRPGKGADPKTPILKTSMQIEMGGQKSSSNLTINLDGTTSSGTSSQYSSPGGSVQ